eukprot:CAMPEP_0172510626 /NCGR_PEP_ID=MMETSP1066-20121228/230197_1 /TAXON_ID=671091 /ORGANISM="Coscinodiscus wailesii, Strain CCMP2513" /LENGTH=166 /DNA_ID=CAMNT_0013289693 /DNA_START=41 /DNA_END=537 /DNA_ORIENTATION=+
MTLKAPFKNIATDNDNNEIAAAIYDMPTEARNTANALKTNDDVIAADNDNTITKDDVMTYHDAAMDEAMNNNVITNDVTNTKADAVKMPALGDNDVKAAANNDAHKRTASTMPCPPPYPPDVDNDHATNHKLTTIAAPNTKVTTKAAVADGMMMTTATNTMKMKAA